MPPVADTETTEWGKAMHAALTANKEAGLKPDSWRSLYAALGALTDTTADSKKRTINRYRKPENGRPGEEMAELIAKALGAPRDTLPRAEQASLALLAYRLEELGDKVDQLLVEQATTAQGILAAIARGPMPRTRDALGESDLGETSTGQ